MSPDLPLYETLPADSFLEYAFLRWVLTPAMHSAIKAYISPQQEIEVAGHSYRLDYAIIGQQHRVAVELDGFEYHGQRNAFTYDLWWLLSSSAPSESSLTRDQATLR